MLQTLTPIEKGHGLIGRLRQLPAKLPIQSGVIDVAVRVRRRLGLFGWSFILCVILPSLVSSVYLAFIESDEYVSEAHFTIRTAPETRSSSIKDLLGSVSSSLGMGISTGGQASTQDVYIVADYIRSRSIIQDIGGKPVLSAIFSRPSIDWLSRLSSSATFEDAWKYWKRKINAVIDTPSETITLDVRAFTSEEAHNLAELILNKSEALVNEISERSRRDAMTRAQNEVKLAEDRLRNARQALLAFRNKENIIDPTLSAKSIGETITKLTHDKVLLENNRAALGNSAASNSPMGRVYATQIAAIDEQIAKLESQLTSQDKDTALSNKITGYENRQIELEFAQKLYSIAQAGVEKARNEQEKQQLYLVTIDRPSVPDNSTYPRILLNSITIFAGCLILWSMVTLLAASVRDHMGS